ncbi:acetate kinase [Verrucomicrobia bacterium]|nr:acetate kinase [Verrucomicrobiota bacterium]
MKILIANLGSTSMKYRLFDFSSGEGELLVKGGIERVNDHSAAIEQVQSELKDGGWIRSETDLNAVGFKTIMAEGLTGCLELTEQVVESMEKCNYVAPAHNPPYISGIRLFAEKMPETPLVGLFETAFYQWMPEASRRYAVPKSWYDAGVRRWGFHGASHKFIAERSAEILGRKDVASRARNLYVDEAGTQVDGSMFRVVSCHLGGSSSVTGILNGAAIGNSMGLSPQSGLPHNNRVGDLDSMAVLHMMRRDGLSVDEVEHALCNESGLKGLSGKYNDIRDIQSAADSGDANARLALEVFVKSVRHWIGAYMAQLNGLDALVFTAGIGENRAEIRAEICANMDQIGIELDPSKNSSIKAEEAIISSENSTVKVLVIPTNEELVVAREVKRFLENKQN